MMLEELRKILQDAFDCSLQQCFKSEFENPDMDKKMKNSGRSRVWVDTLAESLLKLSKEENGGDDTQYQAFYRKIKVNQRDQVNQTNAQMFGLTEFLFDIVIAEMIWFDTASGHRNTKSIYSGLPAIRKAMWIVESEFKPKDSRAILLDMNKLVLGKADYKLFIMSQDDGRIKEWAKAVFTELSRGDTAKIFLAQVLHPKDWESKDRCVEVIEINTSNQLEIISNCS